MILAIRTDAPEVYLGLLDREGKAIEEETWLAERRLSLELLGRLEQLLGRHGAKWDDLDGLIVFQGPGSFTGLRIGITVMNTIAYGAELPIVGVSGEAWLSDGTERLGQGKNDQIVLPEYGAPAHITQPRK